MTAEKIREKLFLMQDLKYRDFTSSLIPTVDKERIIGVRTPVLKSFAKELMREAYEMGDFSEIKTRWSGASGMPRPTSAVTGLFLVIIHEISPLCKS